MARGLELKKTRALDLITEVYSKHPRWGAPEVHKEVFARLHDKNDRYYEPYLDDPNWPRENTVYQHLKKIRKKDEARSSESKELGRPWSVSALADYPIPPEALPTVMSFYKKRLAGDDVLLIREALWIARLCKIIDPPDLVWDWAFLYALEEMLSEIQGKPFNSTRLDLEMISNPYHAREVQREIAIWKIAEKYGADPVKLKDLNLSIDQTEEIAKSGKYKKEVNHERTHTSKE